MIDIDHTKIRQLAHANKLLLVVLFGSQATGHTHSGSDTDIAYFSQTPLSFSDQLKLEQQFANELQLGVIQLVDMRTTATLLLKRIADQGIVLYESDPSQFDEFQLRAYKLYSEAKPLREHRAQLLKEFTHHYD